MMNDRQLNNRWLAERVSDVRASIADLRREVGPLAYLQLGWRPPEGGWSIAQVIEHLIITDESYLEPIERLVRREVRAVELEDAFVRSGGAVGLTEHVFFE